MPAGIRSSRSFFVSPQVRFDLARFRRSACSQRPAPRSRGVVCLSTNHTEQVEAAVPGPPHARRALAPRHFYFIFQLYKMMRILLLRAATQATARPAGPCSGSNIVLRYATSLVSTPAMAMSRMPNAFTLRNPTRSVAPPPPLLVQLRELQVRSAPRKRCTDCQVCPQL